MKNFVYIAAITISLLLTTSCVDLTQEPKSFTRIYGIITMDLTITCNA